MTYDEKIKQLDEELAKKQKRRDHLLVIKTAESEIPAVWNTGQVTQAQLAKEYGISQVTVRRILVDAGCVISRKRKLSVEERSEVAALLQKGERVDHLAGLYHVSRNTIRRVGLAEGALVQGVRRPRRSDEEYALIDEFDRECRQRFNGAGLYSLGLGLKQWKNKKLRQEVVLERASTPPDVAYVDTPDTIDESAGGDPNHPLNQDPPPPADHEGDTTVPQVEWPPPSHETESPFAVTQEDNPSF